MGSHLPGPARFGAIIMVTVLSCVVLGAVWGFVVYLLPESTNPPALSSRSPSPAILPPAVQPSPILNLDNPGPAVHPAPPVMVREESTPAPSPARGRSVPEAARLPFGMELKCAMEIDSLCPEEEGDRRICLQRKAEQLPRPCRPMLRERLVRMKEHMQQMRAACETDRRQYCRDESLAGGAIVQCLESHAQEVSDQCFQFLPKRGRLLNYPLEADD